MTVSAPLSDTQEGSLPHASFWKALNVPARGEPLIKALHEGFAYRVYGRLVTVSGLDRKELAKIAVLAPATLSRRAKHGRFTTDESDRLYRFARVLEAAVELFEGDKAQAVTWLRQPVKGLGNRRPVEMIGTSVETQAVLDLIGRLEHGVFS